MPKLPSYLPLLAACVLTLLAGCTAAEPVAVGDDDAAPPVQRVRLLFAGDVMCHAPQITAASRNAGGRGYDFSPTFRYVKPLFDSADAAVVNLETVISPDGRYTGYPCFSSPRELAEALADAGVDIAVTANNHCCDRGARGIRATAACLDSLGIARTGTFADSADYARNRILRFTRNDIKFALLNYTYGTNGIPVPDGCLVNRIDTLQMARDLELAADADCRIVFLHWGEEYQRTTNAGQRRIREFLERAGVEVVIGSHPHVIQPAEALGNRIFVSSLGNFVSNQRKRFSDGGLIAEVDVVRTADGAIRYSLKLTPVWVRLPRYEILPPQAADTMSVTAMERAQYVQFLSDTEKLLFAGKFL